jgi:outer membrane protein insertion porin family
VAEVAVRGEQVELPQELQNQVYGAIRTQPGRTTTRSQLQEDINAIFATGFFSNVRAVPEDTPLGVRVSFVVQPNPVLRNVQVQANPGTKVPSVLPPKVVNDVFQEQYGSILNLRRLQEGIKRLNQWYQENGYVLAQVVEAPQVAPDGTVTLQIAEGVVEDIQVRFIREGEATNEEGEPIRGRTRDFIITRELQLEPGQVFNRNTVQTDLQRIYGLGIFEDVQVSLNPGQDPRQVVVLVNVEERRSGSVAAGAGFSSASGLFGTISYQEQNLGGNNQRLGAELQVGERDVLFDVRFTDPWIAGDPFRTSYTVNGFRRRSISLVFDGDDENIVVGDDAVRPRVVRTGGAVTFTRPLSRNPLERSEWTASAGLQYQRIAVRDNDGEISPTGRLDVAGGPQDIPLSISPDGTDDLLTLQLGAVRDLRNNPLTPTSGSLLRFGVEQSVPIGSGSILLNRLRGSYSQYLPVNFTNFAEGPETLAFNLQAGTVIGDLPPYEAFSVGGTNSVRGYDEGQVGSGRSFVQATAEYRFPIFSVVGGTLFVDVGSDLGTAGNVPGRPGELLGKPGTGFGYGVGVRVQSPLGPLRIDYGFNDEGDSRLHFGIGERF